MSLSERLSLGEVNVVAPERIESLLRDAELMVLRKHVAQLEQMRVEAVDMTIDLANALYKIKSLPGVFSLDSRAHTIASAALEKYDAWVADPAEGEDE